MLKSNRVKRDGPGRGGAGKIIDFTFWTVLVPVGSEKDGVIDTSVSCEDARWMMDRCHRQRNKQSCLILSPYYVVVAGRGANCTSLVLESFPASSACTFAIFPLPSFYNQRMHVFICKRHSSDFFLRTSRYLWGVVLHTETCTCYALCSHFIFTPPFPFNVFFFPPAGFYLHSW